MYNSKDSPVGIDKVLVRHVIITRARICLRSTEERQEARQYNSRPVPRHTSRLSPLLRLPSRLRNRWLRPPLTLPISVAPPLRHPSPDFERHPSANYAAQHCENDDSQLVPVALLESLEGVGLVELPHRPEAHDWIAVPPVPHAVRIAYGASDVGSGGARARVPRVVGIVAIGASEVACIVGLSAGSLHPHFRIR